MKIVLTSLAVPSHLWSMVVPTARVLSSAGHDVAVATAAGLADEATRARAGVPMMPLKRMLTHDQLVADEELSRQVGFGGKGNVAEEPDSTPADVLSRFLAGILAERAAGELVELASDRRPDLVIRESLDFSGLLLAERLGIPLVTLDNAPLEAVTRRPGILPWLDRSRTALGIPTDAGMSPVTDGPWVSWIAPGWRPSGSVPADYRSYQAPAPDQDEVLDPAIATLADADGPLVLVAFGSLLRQTVGVDGSPMARVVEALGELPCTAVVALGDDDAVASWSGPRPANVHLTGVVQQRALLPRCDLFVTHAGFGSIREALSAGIPMVSLPLNAEQPANAARLAELGIAVSLDAATATVETIAQACREVLDEPRYRDAAREWQRRTRALPDADVMVRELEAIAASDADHAR